VRCSDMNTKKCLPIWLVCFAAFAFCLVPETIVASPPDKRIVTENRSADACSDVVPPDVWVRELDCDVEQAGNWFVRERKDILHFALGGGISVIVGLWLSWLSGRFFRRDGAACACWRKEALTALVRPLILLLTLVSCFFFFQPLLKSMPRRWYEWDMRFFYAAVVLVMLWGVLRLISVLDGRIRVFARRNDNSLDDLTIGMLGATLKIAIAATALMFICQNIFDLNITALLAGAGVVGLAVALAAKDTVSNFFGTLVIVADSPFRLGDRISAGGVDGIVVHVGMRSSKIATDDESLCTVPNSVLANALVRKSNRRGYLKHVLDIGLSYDTTAEQMKRAMDILHEIMDDFHGPDDREHAPHVFFSGFSDSALTIRAIIWLKCDSFADEEPLLTELHLEVLKRFAEAGLDIAYPTSTVYLAGDTRVRGAGTEAVERHKRG